MPIKSTRLGDGTITVGAAPGLDISAQVVGAVLTSSIDTGDSLTVLSGEQMNSGQTTESEFSGTLILDPTAGGIGEYSWTNHGAESLITFTPNTAAGMTATFSVVMVRLDIGADEYGALLQPEFTWAVIGEPTVTWGVAAP
jgi:hypothetical protein